MAEVHRVSEGRTREVGTKRSDAKAVKVRTSATQKL